MHLIEILNYRHVVCAGISIGITGRCPLSCAHCSTNSTMTSDEYPAETLERFVGTFDDSNRPEIMSLSGGEALLRPILVRSLADRARRVGVRTSVLSGLFFANSRRIPTEIIAAIDAVDHFSASLDVFHEREVPRASAFRVFEQVISRGKDVSLHIVGTGSADPYIHGLVADVRSEFGERIPMLVNGLAHFGRARDWMARPERKEPTNCTANPCSMAAWPVVGFDGKIAACGNDDALARRPKHLIIGDVAVDDWETVRQRTMKSSVLRAIRLYGPEALAKRLGAPQTSKSYCETCMALACDGDVGLDLDRLMEQNSTRFLETEVFALLDEGGADAFLRRHGLPAYVELAHLGVTP